MGKYNWITLTVIMLLLVSACSKEDMILPSSTITAQELKDHVSYLASDELRGRGTGSKGYYIAAGYVASQFLKDGLSPVCTDSIGDSLFFQRMPDTGDEALFRKLCSILHDEGAVAYNKVGETFSDMAIADMDLVQMNVVALVPGSDPGYEKEFITAGAHLDHMGIRRDSIYNGADDNASGCAVILEVAEAVALSHPKRSVLFILYDNEERGMVGSGFFIKNAPVPLEQIKVNINLDMVGRPDGIMTELGILGSDEMDQGLKELIYATNSKTSMLILDSIDSRNYFRRSDQYSFYKEGIPSVLLTTGEHDEYHTPRDDPEKIDYAFLEKVGLLTYEVIMAMANAEADQPW